MGLSESELYQLELLKKKTPSERFLMMIQMIEAQIEAMRSGIRYYNPDISDDELEQCLKKRMIKIYSLKL